MMLMLMLMVKMVKNQDVLTLKGDPLDLLANLEINAPPNFTGAENFDVSPDGTEVAFSGLERTHDEAWNTGWDTFRYDTKTMTAPFNITFYTTARTQNPRYNNDGTKLAFLSMRRPGLESDNLHLSIYILGTSELIEVPDATDRSIIDFMWYDDNTIILVYTDNGLTILVAVDLTIVRDPKFYPILKDIYAYSVPIIVPSKNLLLVQRNSYIRPEDIAKCTYDQVAHTASCQDLTNINVDLLKDFTMSTPESFEFLGGYGDMVQGWLMKPINFDATKAYPLAFLIHGGPEGAWESSWSYRWNPQLWANRGYAVAMINPHGSSGKGIKFQDAVRNDWGGVPYEDLMTGLTYILTTYPFLTSEKVCACGASYGGYMVNWIQGKTDRFKCLVTHDGVFSTVSMFYGTEELWFPKAEYCPGDKIGCTPYESKESREGFEKFSPESLVQNWKTPHLIIHGSMDFRIPVEEGISAFTALQLKGVPSKFIHFPEENHWVLKAENSIQWYDEVIGWMDNYIK